MESNMTPVLFDR